MKECYRQEFKQYEMEQYDWLQDGCFIGRGLHYGQNFYGEDLQPWIEEWPGCQHGNIFC